MKSFQNISKYIVAVLAASALLISCKSSVTLNVATSTSSVKLGGVIKGLALNDQIQLQNSGGAITTFTGNGTRTDSFEFPGLITTGEMYEVTVFSTPLLKTCTPSANVGSAGTIDIYSVQINCGTQGLKIGGNINGLTGLGLVLLNTHSNGTENYSINPGGSPLPFIFPGLVAAGASYTVTVATQPTSPSQTCTPASNTGANVTVDINSVVINCTTNQYTVSGTITGLNPADTVTLQNNGAGNQTITGATANFSFAAANDGTGYNVTALSWVGPTNCTVTNGAGTLAGGPVTNVSIVCTYGASGVAQGTVAGLATGAVLILHNFSENIIITGNGTYSTTLYPIVPLTPYSLTITNPTSPSQTCTFDTANNSGNIPAANVNITCVTNTFTVGGTVSGLGAGTVTLLNNGLNSTPVVANGPFTFSTSMSSGAVYNVSIASTTGGITCTVGSGIGVVTSANITGVTVTCGVSATYTIGGVLLAGLPSPIGTSTGVTLQNNLGDTTVFMANGNFSFPTTMTNGNVYNVTISAQPANPTEVCTVLNPSGMVGSGAVNTVVVTCSLNTYSVSGTVTGLASGEQVTLSNNGVIQVPVIGNGSSNDPFIFTPQNDLTAYNVAAVSSPALKTCTPGANTGTINGWPVSNVTVACAPAGTYYTVGGTVSGLAGGARLIIKNNTTDILSISGNGSYIFPAVLLNGAAYNISIVQQPNSPHQTCSVTNGSGTIPGANVSNVSISCSTNQYSIAGNITGLTGGDTINLQLNGTINLNPGNNGNPSNFSFDYVGATIADQQTYNVTVLTPPAGKICTAGDNTGMINGGSVNNIAIDCNPAGTPKYSIGGTISGLATGAKVVLQNNLGDNLTVTANGTFTFTTSLLNGAGYSVTRLTNPSIPNQNCTVTGGAAGSVAAANVTGVTINCTTSQYTVSANVIGLPGGDPITIVNNGVNPQVTSVNGMVNFPLQNDGSPFNVTVQTLPVTRVCTIGAGTGTLTGSSISTVTVNCSLPASPTYSIGGMVSGLSGTGLAGSGVSVSLNGGSAYTVYSNSNYSFPTTVSSGTIYTVSVLNPTNPSQTCSLTNATGTVAANVNNVNITCVTNTYTISGTASNLAPGESIPILFNGATAILATGTSPTFTSAPINDGTSVAMQIVGGPGTKDCNFTVGGTKSLSGTITHANITTGADITCTNLTKGVRVQVTGMTGGSLSVVNYMSGSGGSNTSNLTISGNGGAVLRTDLPVAGYDFNFQAPGTSYQVVITGQPAGQICAADSTIDPPSTGFSGAGNMLVHIACTPTGGGPVVTALTLGTPMAGTVSAGGIKYYSVAVTPGTLLLRQQDYQIMQIYMCTMMRHTRL